ncbi:antitoxin HicB [Candidatus Falkowbacteria bacterium CG10_big_fil_rev_8_21_14_0_10_44_15]|uniref:Antitoxin HicB n=1 Tax=Candidatus Falkowbacteria bacterium CG10_big_fil_rev_8_21_14_0_10_44_15 TaxID=1974569 RepID=A0A2H0UZE9_9BACT|nr:MAG: antitoxin HicB [Candidatus Falkowbacteria bacterium CG10_big_fil_rev_8_21_14_0_10_44_15]
MENKTFQINLIAEKEGGYTVTVPQLPGCVSYGKTIEEAKRNIQAAVSLHLANVKEHNKRDFKSIINKTVFSVEEFLELGK